MRSFQSTTNGKLRAILFIPQKMEFEILSFGTHDESSYPVFPDDALCPTSKFFNLGLGQDIENVIDALQKRFEALASAGESKELLVMRLIQDGSFVKQEFPPNEQRTGVLHLDIPVVVSFLVRLNNFKPVPFGELKKFFAGAFPTEIGKAFWLCVKRGVVRADSPDGQLHDHTLVDLTFS